jgi:peptidoglycan/LPS O-acetylase OafA/YrhL
MIGRSRTHERLIALFLLGLLLLLPPVLVIFNQPARIAGVPVLYLYLFFAWAILIGLTAAVTRRIGDEQTRVGNGASPPDGDAAERQRDA